MDERVKNEYRKIYAELCSLIMLATAVSIILKIAVFHEPSRDIYFEFLIAVGAPLYLFVRQLMLGIDPYAAEKGGRKGRRKRFFVSLLAAITGMAVVTYGGNMSGKGDLFFNLVVFAAFYTAFYFLGRMLTQHNAERKAGKYEDD